MFRLYQRVALLFGQSARAAAMIRAKPTNSVSLALVSLASMAASFTSLAAPQALPTPSLSVPATGEQTFTISWSGVTGGSSYAFDVEEKIGNGDWTYLDRKTTDLADTLTRPAGGAHSYRVSNCYRPDGVVNWLCSTPSAAKTITVYPQPGNAPTLSCSDCAAPDLDGGLTLNWTRPAGPVTHYRVFSRLNNGGWTMAVQAGATNTARSYSTLANGTWEFKVDACNTLTDANTNCSLNSSPTVVTVLRTPAVPTGLSLPSSSTTGSFTAAWQPASGAITHYQVLRLRHQSATPQYEVVATVNVTPQSNGTSQPFVAHADGTYNFRIKACNAASCSDASALRTIAVLKVPTAPTGLSGAASSNNGIVSLSWGESFETVASYEILEAPKANNTCPSAVSSYGKVDASVAPRRDMLGHADGEFCVRVRACNESGCSSNTSNIVSVSVQKTLEGLPDAEVESVSVPLSDNVGTLVGKGSNNGGRAGYSITIPVPPGRKGVAPEVSLNYSSGSGPSPVGVGWSISAENSSIYRCAHIEAISTHTRPFTGTLKDRLCIKGQHLLLRSGGGPASYGTQGSRYSPENDPFTTVTLLGGDTLSPSAYFQVKDASGAIHTFDRQQRGMLVDGTLAYPTHWLLTNSKTTDNNRIDFRYSNDVEADLTNIFYTGLGSAMGNREVRFVYETVDNPRLGFVWQGFKSPMTKRLKSVETFVGSTQVHYIKLQHEASNVSGRLLLKSAKLCGNSGCHVSNSFPATAFTYGEHDQLFVDHTITNSEFERLVGIGDVDGDGRKDYVLYRTEGPFDPYEPQEIRLSSEPQPVDAGLWGGALSSRSAFNLMSARRADFNHDGRDDLLGVKSNGEVVGGIWNAIARRIEEVDTDLDGKGIPWDVRDYDLDGDADVVMLDGQGRLMLYTNYSTDRPDRWDFADAPYQIPAMPDSSSSWFQHTQIDDLNGDGYPDLILLNSGTGGAHNTFVRFGYFGYTAGGGSNSFVPEWYASALFSLGHDLGGPDALNDGNIKRLDVNGDGLSDLFKEQDGNNTLWINTGGRFVERAVTNSIVVNRYLATGLVVMDYDRDGRDDLLSPGALKTRFCWNGGVTPGPNSEPYEVCTASDGYAGLRTFESGQHPEQNKGVYYYDVVKFIQNPDGTFTLSQDATLLSGVLHGTSTCDANDDGLTDLCSQQTNTYGRNSRQEILVISSGGGPLGSYAQLTKREQAFGFDQLTQVTNGLGAQEQWTYSPLSGLGDANCGYSAEKPFYKVDLAGNSTHHYHFSASMAVVASHRASNAVGGMNEQCLRYEDAMFSTRGRGFQGFKAIVVDENLKDGHDKSTRTSFYDYFPLTGKPLNVQVRLRNDAANATPLSETLSAWNSYTIDDTKFVYLEQEIAVTYNVDVADRPTLNRSTTVNTYAPTDLAQGNLTSQKTISETFDAGTLIVRNQSETTYQYDYSQVNEGFFDKVVKKTVTTSPTMYALAGPQPDAESNNTEVATEDYDYYNGTRRLESKTVQKNVSSQELKETYHYDGYGQVERIVLSTPGYADRESITGYGLSDGYFPGYTLAGGHVTNYEHDAAFGLIKSQRNADGTSVQFEYDFSGRMTVSRPNVGQPIYYVKRRCQVDCGNAIVQQMTIAANAPTAMTFVDMAGRELKKQAATGNDRSRLTTVTSGFDARGRKLFETAPATDGEEYKTEYRGYDPLGRHAQKIVNRSGHVVGEQVWNYAYAGLKTTITLPDGRLTATRQHDGDGLLLMTRDAIGGETHHRYDGNGAKILTQDPKGVLVAWYYDALGRNVKTMDPDAGTWGTAPAEIVAFNGYGERVQMTDAAGRIITASYDTLGRPTLRYVQGVLDSKWIYDLNGKPSLSREESGDKDNNGVADFVRAHEYDGFGRPIRVQTSIQGAPSPFVDRWAYDANHGRMKGRAYPSGEMVYYTYGTNGFPTGESRAWGGAQGQHAPYYTINAHSARGQIEEILYANGVEAVLTYANSTGDVTGLLYKNTQTGQDLADLRYFYNDAFGNLTRRDDRTVTASEVFQYDDLQRLDSSAVTWTNGTPGRTVDYSYDEVGNLLEKDDFGHSYQYGDVTRSSASRAGPHGLAQLTLNNGQVVNDFRYDAAGNMIAGNGRSIEYDAFNKPTKIREAAGVTDLSYGPDLSLAVRREGSKTTYYGNGYQLVMTGTSVQAERTFIGAHVVVEKAGSTRKVRYQHYDRLGSAVMTTDEQGGVTERHAFDAFGAPLQGDWQANGGALHGGTGAERLTEKGYTGHEHLETHKLIHMGGRVYDPMLGRFMSTDPFVVNATSTQSLNPYAYVMNNPLSNVDPSGYHCHGNCADDPDLPRQEVDQENPSQPASSSQSDVADFIAWQGMLREAEAADRVAAENAITTSRNIKTPITYDDNGVANAGHEVIVTVGTLPGRTWTDEERMKAYQHMRDLTAQAAHSIDRYHQFNGKAINNSIRIFAEVGHEIALEVVSMGATRGARLIPRLGVPTKGAAVGARGRIGYVIKGDTDRFIRNAKRSKAPQDTTVVVGHGAKNDRHIWRKRGGEWTGDTPEQVAGGLRNQGRHRLGNDIRVNSCNSAGPCAQGISNATGERTWGSTDLVHAADDGRQWVGHFDEAGEWHGGGWVAHHPEGFIIGVTPIR